MKKLLYIFAIVLIVASCGSKKEEASDRFTEEYQASSISIFEKMKQGGVDTNQPLLYGFFFFDDDEKKLEPLKEQLLTEGYTFVRMEATEKAGYILHVEKIEVHTPQSLLEREKYLFKLAEKHHVELYDGWDVGNPDPTKPLHK